MEETPIDLNYSAFTHSQLQQALGSHTTRMDNNYDDSIEIAQFLIEAGTNVDNPSVISSRNLSGIRAYHTALQCSAMKDNTHLVQELLKHGATVNSAPLDHHGATALQYAAVNGNIEMASALLEAGADINAPACKTYGRSAIEGAAEHGRLNMVHYLLENGADIQGKTNTAYRRACWRAWNEGRNTVIRYIQDYKSARFGDDDCDTEEHLIRSVPKRELRQELIDLKLFDVDEGEESEDDLDRARSWRGRL
jgi:ankyrin repeat protein